MDTPFSVLPFSVLHVLPSLDPRRGGPVTAVAELVRGLRDAGIPSAIAVPASEVSPASLLGHVVSCPVLRVPFGPLVRMPRRLPLPAPTILHVHGLGSLTPWSPFAFGAPRGPVVATLHGVLDRRLAVGVGGLRRVWHERLDVALLRRLDGLHVTRDSEADTARTFLAAGVGPAVLPWALGDAAQGPRSSPGTSAAPRGERGYFLYVGRLHRIKGIERLLAGLAHPAGPRGDTRLLLAGAGSTTYRAELARRARALGIRPRIEFLGAVGAVALRALYAEALAAVLPSHYENFGMVVLEAMREGCPVIAARETPWEGLEAAGAGRWVDFDRPEAVAAAAVEVLDPVRRSALGAGARAWYRESFTPAQVVPGFRAWYESVLRKPATRRTA